MTSKKIEQPFRDAVAHNMEVSIDRAMLCPNDLGKTATPFNYYVFRQVGYFSHDKVHSEIYTPVKELFHFHLWSAIRNTIFNCLHKNNANT
jgi:hypothetical protein